MKSRLWLAPLTAVARLPSCSAASCAAFDVLPQRTVDAAAAQRLSGLLIAFSPDAPRSVLDGYRDALVCRGAQMDAPHYNIGMLTGRVPLEYKAALETSRYIAAVDFDGPVSTLGP
ncbi:hypothetical protein H4R19_002300 [Coemansia spiralis]|nr:hypothetical protein H4R19_002300 [Coemansia spiralis]